MSETTAAATASVAKSEADNTNDDDDDNNNTCVEWPTDPSQYEWIGKIGQGAFASVWRACTTVAIGNANTNANTNTAASTDEITNVLLPSVIVEERKMKKKECAIKVLNLDHVDSNLSEIRLEVQAMRLSSHPNVLSCFAAFVKSTDLWLVTQLMRKGSSLHCLQNARRTARLLQQKNNTASAAAEISTIPILMEKHILYIMHETLLGLQYIHEHNGQIHRDIKAGNILIDHNGDIRIADFGVSGWLINAGKQQEKAKTFVGTPCWMAPEVMEQINGYDYKADIWSLGITAMELAKGYAPYAKYPPMKVLILTIQEDPPSLDTYDEEDGDDTDDWLECYDEEYSKSFRSFVDVCLQKNPAKRPTTSDLLQSKSLIDFKDPAYRESRRKAIMEEVCSLVEDVGSSDVNAASDTAEGTDARYSLPGNTPVSIYMSKEENDRPAGTTWVFADGSQVMSSSAAGAAGSVDDVLDEIDQFGMQTGGEHYNRGESQESQPQAHAQAQAQPAVQQDDDVEEEGDDLDAFMDDFEMNTQGENFRRPARKGE